jgi:uncharacterized integral membrane protein
MFLSYKSIAITLALSTLVLIVIVQNMGFTVIKFLFLEFSMPTIVLIVGCLIIGGILGAILTKYFSRRKG